jgi:hypothetical protein
MDDDSKSSDSKSNNNNNNRVRIKPMALMTGTMTSNLAKQNIREISCVGVPFFKAPGNLKTNWKNRDWINLRLF